MSELHLNILIPTEDWTSSNHVQFETCKPKSVMERPQAVSWQDSGL